jgi:ATP-dependent helicase/nuclease subunit A
MTAHIPPGVLDVQRAASDPSASAWVAANAGSGKTHVLAQRVIRLLLRGTQPEKILCLTYTKAAAANMANRVFDTLAKWTALDDAGLDKAIAGIEGYLPDPSRRVHARRLFAQALDTPGGLKVQTIHAFCTRLLHQFPFEANVAARFEVLEERAQSELIDRLRMAVLLQAAAQPDSALGRALTGVIPLAADQTFAEVIGEAIARQDELIRWVERCGGVAQAIADLSDALGIPADETSETIAQEFFSGSRIAASEHPAMMAALDRGSKSDKEHAARFAALATLTGTERIQTYQSIFCTAELEPRRNIVTKAIRESHPGLFQRLLAEQERVCALIARRRAVETRERTAALVTIVVEIIDRYRAEKNRRGLMDYDDLIDRTLQLLANTNAQWVHYKLDLGVDHVLIDEAQDTSEKQWSIVQALTAEFTAGRGARETARSVFAVGDEKQSIFSFQGAEPAQFARMQRHYAIAHEHAELRFTNVKFQYSFRSTPIVLAAVDTVFQREQAFAGLTEVPGGTVHEAIRANAPGTVDLWPLIEPEERREIEGWDAPFDETQETSPRVKLARRIATSVKRWIDDRIAVGEGEQRHAARPGDVLVLVRQRGALFEEVIRALKEADIPVAGADRLVLTEHIAVMDLIALADALLLPHDELALASVLKSPLFGLTEEQLFALAWKRPGTLRAALRLKASEDLAFAAAHQRLERYATWARHETPFGFYARILGADRGRASFYGRLGAEAADALDEFLEHALGYERREAPTLQGFVAWLRAGDTQVKRDMDIARDEVRVMTVHGAKGLEAPIVILADTTTPPKGPKEPRLLSLPVAHAAPGTAERIVWAGRKIDDVAPVAAARATAIGAAENEYRRLLYVAMTRAADRLVIAGARGLNRAPEGCWYQLVEAALKPDATETEDREGTVLRWRRTGTDASAGAAADAPLEAPHDLPDWLQLDVPAPPAAMRALAPSAALDHAAYPGDARALARGRIVHRLLQALPALSADRRAEAARRHLEGAKELSGAERAAISGEVLAVLGDSRFAPLFGPGSRAEVPIVGIVSRNGRRVSGQVDRLAVTATEVLLADYKSDRRVPQRVEDIPGSYVGQLALYAEVLRALYPNHRIRAAIVWTAGPSLTELPAAALDAAMSRLGMSRLGSP